MKDAAVFVRQIGQRAEAITAINQDDIVVVQIGLDGTPEQIDWYGRLREREDQVGVSRQQIYGTSVVYIGNASPYRCIEMETPGVWLQLILNES